MGAVDKALWFIESHFEQDINLDEIAKVAGVSRFHISRAFSLAMGCSISSYVRGRRLTQAALSLANGAPEILTVAIDAGYDKALLTIVDSHVTTLITGFALFLFGTGPIKGFAVTLCLGIAINLFTALVGTKVIFDLFNQRKKIEQLSI